ncbi:unnamed protein product [Calicophoron daubneyi]|uniref:Thioredoxin domain-containing protein n=1 Tax=Calicophoron daubneyi TaxID=300641 RepID=A0AAV2TA72_CALDB
MRLIRHLVVILILFISVRGFGSNVSVDNGRDSEQPYSAQGSDSFVPSNLSDTKNESKGKVASRNWLFSHPYTISGGQALTRPLSRCSLIPVNWANISLGRLWLLSRAEVDKLFSPTRKPVPRKPTVQSFGINQSPHLPTTSAARFAPTTEHECYVLFIYSTTCRFSVAAFPYIRALARAYPQLKMVGVKVEDYIRHRWSLRMLFVPKLKIIVDSRILREYAGSDSNLDEMIDFVWLITHQLPKGPVGIRSTDFLDNPPEPPPRTDICLIASWIMTILGCVYLFSIFSSRKIATLSAFLHRISRGRYGSPPPDGSIQNWDPGQVTPAH